jgi:hypothetical protein
MNTTLAQNFLYGYIDTRAGTRFGQLRYIGLSSTGMSRPRAFSNHYGWCGNWVKKLKLCGLKPEIEILEEYPDDISFAELGERETELIAYYKFIGCDLTNIVKGGGGTKGYHHTAESRKIISITSTGRPNVNKGKNRPPELVEKSASKMRGRPNGRKGIPLPEAQRAAMSKSRMGHVTTKETRLKLRAKNKSKPFKDQYGNLYHSLGDASEILGLKKTQIQQVLKGKRKSWHGYIFTYTNETK